MQQIMRLKNRQYPNGLALLITCCGIAACTGDPPAAGDPAAIGETGHDPLAATAPAPLATNLGMVTNVHGVSCPAGAPQGSTCTQITVTGCPLIETAAIDATIALLAPTAPLTGTVVHFKGGGGEGFQLSGTTEYAAAGLRQVFVSWASDWEATPDQGIKTAGCRPSTVLAWVFQQIHGSSRALAFCGEGFSGGSGQLGYALAHYGMAGVLDYVNELSGPPFARIDLGCDGDAPPTATVCGATVTTQLPGSLNVWENIQPPLSCGATNVPATEKARWRSDSIAVGGVYNYPRTRVEFFDCTNRSTAVTAMAQIYFNTVLQASGGDTSRVAFHCYSQADGCQGEALGTGSQDAIDAMVAGCKPRHQ
jgi:hypothetical protein